MSTLFSRQINSYQDVRVVEGGVDRSPLAKPKKYVMTRVSAAATLNQSDYTTHVQGATNSKFDMLSWCTFNIGSGFLYAPSPHKQQKIKSNISTKKKKMTPMDSSSTTRYQYQHHTKQPKTKSNSNSAANTKAKIKTMTDEKFSMAMGFHTQHRVIPPRFQQRDPLKFVNMNFEKEIEFIKAKPCNANLVNCRVHQLYISDFIERCIKIVNRHQNTKSNNTEWNIFSFGSKILKIDTVDSDIDIGIDMKQTNVHRSVKQITLRKIMERIRKFGKYKFNQKQNELYVEDITNARYPIISIRDKCFGIKIDLSVADEHCMKTTEYISSLFDYYEQFGIPIRTFIIFIKYWSKKCGINNSLKGYLNSFGYTLMAINYIHCLLCCKNPYIANIQRVSCLVAGFFLFYGEIFEHNVHCIDIVKKATLPFKTSKSILEIVDPVNRDNNVAKNVGIKQWNHIQSAMRKAYKIYYEYIQRPIREDIRLSVLEWIRWSRKLDVVNKAYLQYGGGGVHKKEVKISSDWKIWAWDKMFGICGGERALLISKYYSERSRYHFTAQELSVWLFDSSQSLIELLVAL